MFLNTIIHTYLVWLLNSSISGLHKFWYIMVLQSLFGLMWSCLFTELPFKLISFVWQDSCSLLALATIRGLHLQFSLQLMVFFIAGLVFWPRIVIDWAEGPFPGSLQLDSVCSKRLAQGPTTKWPIVDWYICSISGELVLERMGSGVLSVTLLFRIDWFQDGLFKQGRSQDMICCLE